MGRMRIRGPNQPGDDFSPDDFLITAGIIIIGVILYYSIPEVYKRTHWTKADYAMVEGKFNNAIELVEKSHVKDNLAKLELYNKIYYYATEKAGINDPDHPILEKLYTHGVERKDPILFFDKKKGEKGRLWGHYGKWTSTFPVWKKKLPITRRSPRTGRRQTRRNHSSAIARDSFR